MLPRRASAQRFKPAVESVLKLQENVPEATSELTGNATANVGKLNHGRKA
jgi:hypothetical protein